MSEELKRKLYNYDVEPPEIMWSRIVATLDQEINAEFPQRLYTLETPPPFDAWNRIEEKLEEDIQEQYPTKLYNLEIAPPPETWNKILTLLDEEKAIPEIPSKRRIISFVRYAVAACIIGLIALGTLKLLNQKTDSGSTALKTVSPRKDSSLPVIRSQIRPNK